MWGTARSSNHKHLKEKVPLINYWTRVWITRCLRSIEEDRNGLQRYQQENTLPWRATVYAVRRSVVTCRSLLLNINQKWKDEEEGETISAARYIHLWEQMMLRKFKTEGKPKLKPNRRCTETAHFLHLLLRPKHHLFFSACIALL